MGEVVPLDPMVVRAPVDGIVDRMVVHPFQIVSPGDQLVLFEQLKIDNQITVARETLNGAEEELRQAKRGALFLTDSTLRLPELEVKREEARAEPGYLLELKARMGVTASHARCGSCGRLPILGRKIRVHGRTPAHHRRPGQG